MNKLMAVTAMTLCAASLNAMSLAEARGKTDAVISNPAEMTSVIQQLSAADQKTFVADVNAAIADLPGSAEERSAKIANVARAAIKGASKDNAKDLESLVAEIYATAPVESLCNLNEDLAKDVFNRAGDPKKTYTDDQFAGIAKSLVSAVNSRVAGTEDADVRGGFASLMMIRASNGSPESLAADLASTLGANADTAKNEWFPEALRKPANYDPMLAGTAAEKAPDASTVTALAGAQRSDVLLSAFYQNPEGKTVSTIEGFGDMSKIQSFDHDLYTRPRTMEDKPWNPDPGAPAVEPDPGPRPPYPLQTIN